MLDFYYCKLLALQQKTYIPQLKTYLNLLIKPSPSLTINDAFNISLHEAIKKFKAQFNLKKGKTIVEDGSITYSLWRFVGDELISVMKGSWVKLEYNNLRQNGHLSLVSLLIGIPDSNYTKSMSECDKKLAEIFEGIGAVVASIFEPAELKKFDGSILPGTGKPRGYGYTVIPCNDLIGTNDKGRIIHIYANEQGLPINVGVYAPNGFTRISKVKNENGKEILLEPKSNNQQYFFNNSQQKPLYIIFAHVKTLGVSGIGTKNANGSMKIGNIGGLGGITAPGEYAHCHIVFFSAYFGNPFTGTRVDPREYFCL